MNSLIDLAVEIANDYGFVGSLKQIVQTVAQDICLTVAHFSDPVI